MKFRLFYFFILGVIVLSILTGIFIWHKKQLKQIPMFNQQTFNTPASSKYIPAHADIVFHWKLNPTLIPNYISNFQDKISRPDIYKKINLIRDSALKLTSLDFSKDISKWVGDYGSFAVFDSNKQNSYEWIMVLPIKEDLSNQKELEFILSSKNLKENENISDKLSAPKAEIIPIETSSNRSIYYAKSKNNILIASNPEIIQSSLNNLNNKNTLNTKEKYKNVLWKDNIKDGFLLLEMSPKKILNVIGQEEFLFDLNEIDHLISSINLDKNRLNFEGIISYNIKTEMPSKGINYNSIDVKSLPTIITPMKYLDILSLSSSSSKTGGTKCVSSSFFTPALLATFPTSSGDV